MNNFSKRKRNVKYKERCTHTPIERTIYVERDTYRERESEQKLYKEIERETEKERERERMNSNPKRTLSFENQNSFQTVSKMSPNKTLTKHGNPCFSMLF